MENGGRGVILERRTLVDKHFYFSFYFSSKYLQKWCITDRVFIVCLVLSCVLS